MNTRTPLIASALLAASLISGAAHAALPSYTFTDLGTLGGTYSAAVAINAFSQVAGWAYTTGNAQHATLWNGTTVIDLGTLGGTYSVATAINASGQVAGRAKTTGDAAIRATLWNGTTATDLGTLGGTDSIANAINASGQVVGWAYTTGNAAIHATLWSGTTATDLNSLLDASTVSAGWVLVSASGINDSGWISVNASNGIFGITNHAVLLSVTSVPEPETYGMMLTGLSLVGFIARRRKLAKV